VPQFSNKLRSRTRESPGKSGYSRKGKVSTPFSLHLMIHPMGFLISKQKPERTNTSMRPLVVKLLFDFTCWLLLQSSIEPAASLKREASVCLERTSIRTGFFRQRPISNLRGERFLTVLLIFWQSASGACFYHKSLALQLPSTTFSPKSPRPHPVSLDPRVRSHYIPDFWG